MNAAIAAAFLFTVGAVRAWGAGPENGAAADPARQRARAVAERWELVSGEDLGELAERVPEVFEAWGRYVDPGEISRWRDSLTALDAEYAKAGVDPDKLLMEPFLKDPALKADLARHILARLSRPSFVLPGVTEPLSVRSKRTPEEILTLPFEDLDDGEKSAFLGALLLDARLLPRGESRVRFLDVLMEAHRLPADYFGRDIGSPEHLTVLAAQPAVFGGFAYFLHGGGGAANTQYGYGAYDPDDKHAMLMLNANLLYGNGLRSYLAVALHELAHIIHYNFSDRHGLAINAGRTSKPTLQSKILEEGLAAYTMREALAKAADSLPTVERPEGGVPLKFGYDRLALFGWAKTHPEEGFRAGTGFIRAIWERPADGLSPAPDPEALKAVLEALKGKRSIGDLVKSVSMSPRLYAAPEALKDAVLRRGDAGRLNAAVAEAAARLTELSADAVKAPPLLETALRDPAARARFVESLRVRLGGSGDAEKAAAGPFEALGWREQAAVLEAFVLDFKAWGDEGGSTLFEMLERSETGPGGLGKGSARNVSLSVCSDGSCGNNYRRTEEGAGAVKLFAGRGFAESLMSYLHELTHHVQAEALSGSPEAVPTSLATNFVQEGTASLAPYALARTLSERATDGLQRRVWAYLAASDEAAYQSRNDPHARASAFMAGLREHVGEERWPGFFMGLHRRVVVEGQPVDRAVQELLAGGAS